MNDFGVIFTSIVSSSAVAAIISSSYAEEKERWVLRRSKIEEIYLSSSTWLKFVVGHFLRYISICDGTLTFNQVLDMELKDPDKAIGEQHLKMKMNVEMYERSLLPALRRVERDLESLSKMRMALKGCYVETAQATEFMSPLRDQIRAFGIAGDAFVQAVVQRGAEIGAERGQAARAYHLVRVRVSDCTKRAMSSIFRKT